MRLGLLRLGRIRLLLCLRLLGSSRRLLLSRGRSAHLLRFASQSATDIGGLNLRAALGYLLGLVLRRRLLCLRLRLLLLCLLLGQFVLRGCALLRFRLDYLVSIVGSLVLRRPSFLLGCIGCSLWRSYLRLGGSGAFLWRWSARRRGLWGSLPLCSAGSTRWSLALGRSRGLRRLRILLWRWLRLWLLLCRVCRHALGGAWLLRLLLVCGRLGISRLGFLWLCRLRGSLLRAGRRGRLGCLLRFIGAGASLLCWLYRAFLRGLGDRLRGQLRGITAGRRSLWGVLRRGGAKACAAAWSLNRFVRFALWLLVLSGGVLLLFNSRFGGGFCLVLLCSGWLGGRTLGCRLGLWRLGCRRWRGGLSLLLFCGSGLACLGFFGAGPSSAFSCGLGGRLRIFRLGSSRLGFGCLCRLRRSGLAPGCLFGLVLGLAVLIGAVLGLALRLGGLCTRGGFGVGRFLGRRILVIRGLGRTGRASFGRYWLIDRCAWFVRTPRFLLPQQ